MDWPTIRKIRRLFHVVGIATKEDLGEYWLPDKNQFFYSSFWKPDTSQTRRTYWGDIDKIFDLNQDIPVSEIDGDPLDFFKQNLGAPRFTVIRFNEGKDGIDSLKLWDLIIVDV